MQTPLFHLFLLALIAATTGLMVASFVYFSLRAFEKQEPQLTFFFSAFMSLALLVLVAVTVRSIFLYLLILLCATALCGAVFHQKSGGASYDFGEAIVLMLLCALLTLIFEAFIAFLTALWFPRWNAPFFSTSSPIGCFFSFLRFACVPVPPLLLWLYQTSRLRPGLDRPLDAGETES